MSADPINPQFEAAFVRKYGFGRMTASSNDEAMAMYAAAYWAWNEALKSVVVELPKAEEFDGYYNSGIGYHKCDVIAAIEKAGVRVAE